MKFKNYLETIAGVGIFPVITLIIFFAFFTLLSIWALRVRQDHLNTMNNLPFSTDGEQSHNHNIQAK